MNKIILPVLRFIESSLSPSASSLFEISDEELSDEVNEMRSFAISGPDDQRDLISISRCSKEFFKH